MKGTRLDSRRLVRPFRTVLLFHIIVIRSILTHLTLVVIKFDDKQTGIYNFTDRQYPVNNDR